MKKAEREKRNAYLREHYPRVVAAIKALRLALDEQTRDYSFTVVLTGNLIAASNMVDGEFGPDMEDEI